MGKKRKNRYKSMIAIEDKLISGDLKEEFFMCDLAKCKGACCVEGDLGAPLEEHELPIMKEVYSKVKPYMRKQGKRAVQEQGVYLKDFTGNWSTPLVKGKECAYVTLNEQGIALCAIEQAYRDGEIDFQKPVSCHLYPIRIRKFSDHEVLNYDRWDICSPACETGKTAAVRVYEFTKTALIRKYGEEFYEILDQIIKRQLAEEADESEA